MRVSNCNLLFHDNKFSARSCSRVWETDTFRSTNDNVDDESEQDAQVKLPSNKEIRDALEISRHMVHNRGSGADFNLYYVHEKCIGKLVMNKVKQNAITQ